MLGSVARDLESLQSELARNGSDRLAQRYAPVARQWHAVVSLHIAKLDAEAEANQEIPNPYVVGVPLTTPVLGLMESPGGAPESIPQLGEPYTPCNCIVWLYAVPTVP